MINPNLAYFHKTKKCDPHKARCYLEWTIFADFCEKSIRENADSWRVAKTTAARWIEEFNNARFGGDFAPKNSENGAKPTDFKKTLSVEGDEMKINIHNERGERDRRTQSGTEIREDERDKKEAVGRQKGQATGRKRDKHGTSERSQEKGLEAIDGKNAGKAREGEWEGEWENHPYNEVSITNQQTNKPTKSARNDKKTQIETFFNEISIHWHTNGGIVGIRDKTIAAIKTLEKKEIRNKAIIKLCMQVYLTNNKNIGKKSYLGAYIADRAWENYKLTRAKIHAKEPITGNKTWAEGTLIGGYGFVFDDGKAILMSDETARTLISNLDLILLPPRRAALGSKTGDRGSGKGGVAPRAENAKKGQIQQKEGDNAAIT
ncbi:MAG: hypothetical protein LBQ52_04490 [Helicobacteraceae bacterium]|jgi:hypothetical protein|nr:hypothetical protein [Helicobacteraceae bacterium]